MSKRTMKAAKVTEAPVSLRIPAGLQDRIDALLPKINADVDQATVMGGVTRSSVIRFALVEGVKALEKRYKLKP